MLKEALRGMRAVTSLSSISAHASLTGGRTPAHSFLFKTRMAMVTFLSLTFTKTKGMGVPRAWVCQVTATISGIVSKATESLQLPQ